MDELPCACRANENCGGSRLLLFQGLMAVFSLFVTGAGDTATLRFPAGVWEVSQVAVDRRDQPHWDLEPNDPRLLGRHLTISSAGELGYNDGSVPCTGAKWKSRGTTTLSKLVEAEFPRPRQAGRPKEPTLADFELVSRENTVAIYAIECAAGNSDAENRSHNFWRASWLASARPRVMYAKYGSGSLLVLSLVTKESAPKASFRCGNDMLPSEVAICGSDGLAAYDRSVAAAIRRSVQRNPSQEKSIRADQKGWLVTRNQCGTDAVCLEEKMRDRIDLLMQR